MAICLLLYEDGRRSSCPAAESLREHGIDLSASGPSNSASNLQGVSGAASWRRYPMSARSSAVIEGTVRPGADYLRFVGSDLRNRTPGPPPFSAMN
jgi:hypothetical protein